MSPLNDVARARLERSSFLQVVHSVPGRMRLRFPPLRARPPAFAGEVADRCVERGILDVDVSARTGSIVVLYDPALVPAQGVVGIVRRATGAQEIVPPGVTPPRVPEPRLPAAPSKLALAAAAFFEELNDDVRLATDGETDLATLLPFGFVGLGLAEVAASREMPMPPWFSLFWWSFRSFLSLNTPAIEAAAEERSEEAAAGAA